MGRPVFHPELGEFFRTLREGRGLGLRQAAQLADNKGLASLTKSALHSLEVGKTKNLEPDVLRALATLYGVEYAALAARFVSVKYQIDIARDPSRHTRTGQRISHQPGESVDPASDREIADLRRRIEEYKKLLGQVENAASTLATVIAAGEQVGKTSGAQSKARRRDRKAG